jgi:hypothetical protein
VDGNTDGYFLNKSTTHTHYEQGAWWQVDLGSEATIGAPEMVPVFASKDKPLEIAGAIE